MTDAKRLMSEASPLPWSITINPGVNRLNPKDAALIAYAVNHLPDYLAAAAALERLMAALDGDATDDMGAVSAAVGALSRLRGAGMTYTLSPALRLVHSQLESAATARADPTWRDNPHIWAKRPRTRCVVGWCAYDAIGGSRWCAAHGRDGQPIAVRPDPVSRSL